VASCISQTTLTIFGQRSALEGVSWPRLYHGGKKMIRRWLADCQRHHRSIAQLAQVLPDTKLALQLARE
jgi:hypothetical protein